MIEKVLVRVDEVTAEGIALCTDSYGTTHHIPTTARRGKGPLPVAGEFWIVDRAYGSWSFAVCTQAVVPEVEGAIEQGTAQEALLEALSAQGLVQDKALRVPPGSGDSEVNWEPWMNVSP